MTKSEAEAEARPMAGGKMPGVNDGRPARRPMSTSEYGLPGASAADRVYHALRDAIVEGRYGAGTMLGEAALAAQFTVSRTPVRSALLRLQSEGWIIIYPKRGALVQGISERARADLADARLVLESSAMGQASADVLDRLVVELERSIEQQRDALAEGDVRRYIDLTIAFHRHFVEAGHNDVLLELNDRLADRQRSVLFAAGERLLAEREQMLAEHQQLIDLIRIGDIPGFTAALHDHIAHTYAASVPPVMFSRQVGEGAYRSLSVGR